jgi:hypothetical protein
LLLCQDSTDNRATGPTQTVNGHAQTAMMVAAPFNHQHSGLRLGREQRRIWNAQNGRRVD